MKWLTCWSNFHSFESLLELRFLLFLFPFLMAVGTDRLLTCLASLKSILEPVVADDFDFQLDGFLN